MQIEYRRTHFLFSYGTRPGGKSFDKVGRKSKLPNEGLYMRHLLRHLSRPDLSIKAVLDSIYPSLAQVLTYYLCLVTFLGPYLEIPSCIGRGRLRGL